MPRYKLTLEDDGGSFRGWQRQANGPSVQAALEAAVEAFCGERVSAVAAGRTDSGVHAAGQVIHIDLEREAAPERIQEALNHHLRPDPIAVLRVETVEGDFHARFSARLRTYRYLIVNRRAPPALMRGRAWHVSRPLDGESMHEAAQLLVGHHDFTSFRAALCQATSPLKTLDRLTVLRRGEEIEITAEARSFLHHQVRNMVGTLRLVGEGKRRIDDVETALHARNRAAAGPTAPAHGLCLMRVTY